MLPLVFGFPSWDENDYAHGRRRPHRESGHDYAPDVNFRFP